MHLSCGVIPVWHGGVRPVFWGHGVWSVDKKDEDNLRAKGRYYCYDNWDNTGIPPRQVQASVQASVLLVHHGEMETKWYGEKVPNRSG